jgi:hypothetical protein
MSSIKALVGKTMTKSVKFLDSTVTISKLTVGQVQEIQEAAKQAEAREADFRKQVAAAEASGGSMPESQDKFAGLDILKKIIVLGVEGGSDLTDEDFQSLPMDELSKVSKEIMKFSGLGEDSGK